jgi:hypothetical protein
MSLMPTAAKACYYHWLLGLPEPTGDWSAAPAPTDASSAVAQLESADAEDDAAVTAAISDSDATVITADAQPATPITDPTITSWMINNTTYGYSTNATVDSVVSKILANVQTVAYTSTDVYIKATGIPSATLGSYGSDPAIPTNVNLTYDIPRTPEVNTGTKTAVGLGTIGVAVNGVSLFNPWDGMTYNNDGYWQQNANVFEASTFDSGPGHPAPLTGKTVSTSSGTEPAGIYHYHEDPTSLLNQLDPGNTGQHASPIIGYAADGYPVFGPYGYKTDASGNVIYNSNGQPEVELMTSSYQEVSYTNGIRPDGGPTTAAEPDGSYIQDFTYVAGSGTLDQYNGRYVSSAPGYPDGTYAYYVTTTYPYIIGPDYYGVVQTDDLPNGTITVPGNVTYYTPAVPEPAMGMVILGTVFVLRRRAGGIEGGIENKISHR